jgi:hypothetical protein
MNETPTAYLEALKLLKDWSTALVTIQGVAIGFIGTLVRDQPAKTLTRSAIASIVFFVLSIVSASVVLGALPWLAQPETVATVRCAYEGNFYWMPICYVPVAGWCSGEHLFFVLGLVCLAWYCVHMPAKRNP